MCKSILHGFLSFLNDTTLGKENRHCTTRSLWQGPSHKLFNAFAEKSEGVRFGQTTVKAVATAAGIPAPGLAVIKNLPGESDVKAQKVCPVWPCFFFLTSCQGLARVWEGQSSLQPWHLMRGTLVLAFGTHPCVLDHHGEAGVTAVSIQCNQWDRIKLKRIFFSMNPAIQGYQCSLMIVRSSGDSLRRWNLPPRYWSTTLSTKNTVWTRNYCRLLIIFSLKGSSRCHPDLWGHQTCRGILNTLPLTDSNQWPLDP